MTNLQTKTLAALLLEHDKIYWDYLRRSASTVSLGPSFSSLKFLLTLLKVYVFHYLWLFTANVKLSYRGQKCPDTLHIHSSIDILSTIMKLHTTTRCVLFYLLFEELSTKKIIPSLERLFMTSHQLTECPRPDEKL